MSSPTENATNELYNAIRYEIRHSPVPSVHDVHGAGENVLIIEINGKHFRVTVEPVK